MHMLWDNRNDAELQREFKKPRFLWVITEQYHIAKKSGASLGSSGKGWKKLLTSSRVPAKQKRRHQLEEEEEKEEEETLEPKERRRADVNWRAPEPSGKYRHIPCQQCHRMNKECMEKQTMKWSEDRGCGVRWTGVFPYKDTKCSLGLKYGHWLKAGAESSNASDGSICT